MHFVSHSSVRQFEFEESKEVCVNEYLSAVAPDDIARIYPNPTLGLINIEFVKNNLEEVTIRMVNYIGQEMSQVTLHQPSGIFNINLDKYQNGMYIFEFVSDGLKQTQKVILQ